MFFRIYCNFYKKQFNKNNCSSFHCYDFSHLLLIPINQMFFFVFFQKKWFITTLTFINFNDGTIRNFCFQKKVIPISFQIEYFCP